MVVQMVDGVYGRTERLGRGRAPVQREILDTSPRRFPVARRVFRVNEIHVHQLLVPLPAVYVAIARWQRSLRLSGYV